VLQALHAHELPALVFDAWEPEQVAGRGLLAVANDGNDGGPLCLDSRGGLRPQVKSAYSWLRRRPLRRTVMLRKYSTGKAA
jgi:hypothetical protein